MLVDSAVIILVSAAVVWDVRAHKIPNKLTFPAILIGIGLNVWESGLPGLLVSMQGLALGVGAFLVPFALGGMGGGDVKLVGAVGALKGWVFVLQTALLTVLWGGVIAILAVVATQRFMALRDFGIGLGLFIRTSGKVGMQVMLPHEDVSEKERLAVPYGIAIFAGTISAYFITLPIPG